MRYIYSFNIKAKCQPLIRSLFSKKKEPLEQQQNNILFNIYKPFIPSLCIIHEAQSTILVPVFFAGIVQVHVQYISVGGNFKRSEIRGKVFDFFDGKCRPLLELLVILTSFTHLDTVRTENRRQIPSTEVTNSKV